MSGIKCTKRAHKKKIYWDRPIRSRVFLKIWGVLQRPTLLAGVKFQRGLCRINTALKGRLSMTRNGNRVLYVADQMRQYLTQLRQETGQRIAEKVFTTDDGKPSKWWLCFSRKKFMDKSLGGRGQWKFQFPAHHPEKPGSVGRGGVWFLYYCKLTVVREQGGLWRGGGTRGQPTPRDWSVGRLLPAAAAIRTKHDRHGARHNPAVLTAAEWGMLACVRCLWSRPQRVRIYVMLLPLIHLLAERWMSFECVCDWVTEDPLQDWLDLDWTCFMEGKKRGFIRNRWRVLEVCIRFLAKMFAMQAAYAGILSLVL